MIEKQSDARDAYWLRRATALARKGARTVFPNPPVGAIVVKNNEMVGSGFHAHAGGPHAEVLALEKAGALAKGSTLYVTLEPCAHHGRTPPCVEAIVRAQVSRVVFAEKDPNPHVIGGGAGMLVSQGVVVREFLGADCGLLRAWKKWIREKEPYVTVFTARSINGVFQDLAMALKLAGSLGSPALLKSLRGSLAAFERDVSRFPVVWKETSEQSFRATLAEERAYHYACTVGNVGLKEVMGACPVDEMIVCHLPFSLPDDGAAGLSADEDWELSETASGASTRVGACSVYRRIFKQ